MTEYQEKRRLLIIDKVLLGALIGIAGFTASILLENYKSDRAFQSEIAKVRVERVSEILALLYEREALIDQVLVDTSKVRLMQTGMLEPKAYEYNLEQLEARALHNSSQLDEKKKRIYSLLETNRFWLGEELYEKYSEWAENLGLKVKYFAEVFLDPDEEQQEAAREKFEALDREIRSSKEDIARILKVVN